MAFRKKPDLGSQVPITAELSTVAVAQIEEMENDLPTVLAETPVIRRMAFTEEQALERDRLSEAGIEAQRESRFMPTDMELGWIGGTAFLGLLYSQATNDPITAMPLLFTSLGSFAWIAIRHRPDFDS